MCTVLKNKFVEENITINNNYTVKQSSSKKYISYQVNPLYW